MQKAFLLVYTIFYIIVLLFFLPKEYFKRPSQLRKRWIKEKLGFFKMSEKIQDEKPKIWIHAVSVGEAIAVQSLIKKLSENYEIILSTITDTGQKVARDRFKDYPVKVIYMPFDIPFAIKRVLNFFRPLALILTETELWPNLIERISRKIPVVLVNGRLSDKSFKGYRKIKLFIRPLLNRLSLICVQEQEYKERFLQLGTDERRLHVTGNMKFDIELKEIKFSWETSVSRPVILAGSTHEPEEEIILDTFLNLNISGTLIIAPRHPERFKEVENMIERKISQSNRKIFFSKLSNLSSSFNTPPSASIILIDQIGILGSLYKVCDMAVIGGSFIPHGGQNPLEPAYWKKPVICGPYMYNFPFIEEFIKEKACIMTDKEGLADLLSELLKNSETMHGMGQKAYEIFLKKSGATEKTLKLLKNIIP